MYEVPQTHMSLNEYWAAMEVSEPQAYGIRNVPDEVTTGCNEYWDQRTRYWVAWSIQKAEERLLADRWLGYHIRRYYVSQREIAYGSPLQLGRWIREIGVQVQQFIGQATLQLSTGPTIHDPVKFQVPAAFTDIHELMILPPSLYYTPYQSQYPTLGIRPSYVSISGGLATIWIPRCRLLKHEFFRNYDSNSLSGDISVRPDYKVDDNFYDTVEIWRDYSDPVGATTLLWNWDTGRPCPPGYSFFHQGGGTGLITPTQTAYAQVTSQKFGEVQINPASSSGGTWSPQPLSVRRSPSRVIISYVAGRANRYEPLGAATERAIIAVAHNNMPKEYCKCAIQARYWQRDTQLIEPPVQFGLGPSTEGILEATQIVSELNSQDNPFFGGLL